ncbi:MAG: peptidylprolyl isomerase [Wolinella sp.]
MITWMQKHKKYLVITIWISAIAFVGAGFVGWGEVSFSSSSSWVAKVGDTKITHTEYAREMARLYEFYNRILGGSLDQEQAKSMGIEEQALNKLVSKALMLNFAHDVGIRVNEAEVRKAIVEMKEFQVDGKYDDATYRRILQDNHYKPADFEGALRDSLVLEKLSVILSPKVNELEKEALGASFFLQDDISVKVINGESITPRVEESEVEKFWSENKELYQSGKVYSIIYTLVKNSEIPFSEEDLRAHYENSKNSYLGLDGGVLAFEVVKERVEQDYRSAQAEKSALRRYVEYKKESAPEGIAYALAESDTSFGDELLSQLSSAQKGDALKPLPALGGYIAVKLMDIKESESLSFEGAKESATRDLVAKKRMQMLELRAKEELKNFKGEAMGFVKRDDVARFPQLDAQDAEEFLAQLFQSNEPKGYALIKDKAILFEIMGQKLPKSEEMVKNSDFLSEKIVPSIARIKEGLAEEAFLEYLARRYAIVRNR